MIGNQIAFKDVRVGDFVRVDRTLSDRTTSEIFTVGARSEAILYTTENRRMRGTANDGTITLLDRPVAPSLLDRMLAATYEDSRCKPDIVEIRGMKRALAVVRADIAALHESGDPQGWAPYRDRTFDEILAHLTPEVTR